VGSFECSGGLVVAAGVEGEFAQQFAGGRVDDSDLQVLDEQDDAGSSAGSADADVVQSAVVSQGDRPALSTVSCRIRSWVSRSLVGPGTALGIVSWGAAGVARWGRERCGPQ
jgi:hypothetical protein